MPDNATWTASALAAAYRQKTTSPVEVASEMARRIKAADALHAFMPFDPSRAMDDARRSQARFDKGAPLGVLDGIPVAFKDNIDVAGMVTTGGTPALRNHLPRSTTPVAARLLEAGVIYAGKLNMHELAGGGTTNNPTFGRVANPYRMGAIPGGSSGGSAAAIAARLVPLALGTDTAGSIRNPAHYCGVAGFKPSLNRYPTTGIVPLSLLLDCAGPLALSVADIIAADAVMAGDPAPVAPRTLRGLRLGVPASPFHDNLHREVRSTFDRILGKLDSAGVELVSAEVPGLKDDVAALGLITLGGRFRDDLAAYLGQSGAKVSVDDVFAQIADPFVKGWAEPFYAPNATLRDQYAAVLPRWQSMKAAYADYLTSNRLAGIVFPTAPIPAGDETDDPNDLIVQGERIKGGVWLNVQNTQPGSLWGAPGVSLPMGQTAGGLPLGIEIDGAVGDDKRLLSIALAVEALMPALPPPAFPN